MKKLLAILAVMTLICVGAFAQVPPEYRLKDAEQQYQIFDQLARSIEVDISHATNICALDVTSTGTASLAYLPSTVEYPVKLRIQNRTSTNGVVYIPYSSTVTGLATTTATASRLLDDNGDEVAGWNAVDMILYQNPGITFGAHTGTATVIFEVWERSTPNY